MVHLTLSAEVPAGEGAKVRGGRRWFEGRPAGGEGGRRESFLGPLKDK